MTTGIGKVLTDAVFQRMDNDSELRSLLGVTKPNGALNVYTARPIPEDVEYPLILTVGNTSVRPWDTKTTRGWDIERDIYVYARARHDMLQVENVADRIVELFHRYELQPVGFAPAVVSSCKGPMAAPTGTDFVGLMVGCTWKIEEA